MSKVWIGILLGAVLGLLDGMGAYAYPEVRGSDHRNYHWFHI